MIIKSLSRKRKSGTVRQLLEYVFAEKKRGNFTILHNVVGKNIKDYTKAFERNEENRVHVRKNNTLVMHEIISISGLDRDNISPDILEDITRKYISLRCPYAVVIAVPHTDNKNAIHLHLAISGVDVHTGLSSRVDKKKFAQIKTTLQEYHLAKYPNIQYSTVEHGKREKNLITEKEFQLKKRTQTKSERERTQETVQAIYAKVHSTHDFLEKIIASGLQVYSRNGRVAGVISKRKLRFSSIGIDLQRLQEQEILMEQFKKLREHPNHRDNTLTWER